MPIFGGRHFVDSSYGIVLSHSIRLLQFSQYLTYQIIWCRQVFYNFISRVWKLL